FGRSKRNVFEANMRRVLEQLSRRTQKSARGCLTRSFDCRGEETRPLIPLELALDELKTDQRRRPERVGLLLQLFQAFGKRALVHAVDARVDDAKLALLGQSRGQSAYSHVISPCRYLQR